MECVFIFMFVAICCNAVIFSFILCQSYTKMTHKTRESVCG